MSSIPYYTFKNLGLLSVEGCWHNKQGNKSGFLLSFIHPGFSFFVWMQQELFWGQKRLCWFAFKSSPERKAPCGSSSGWGGGAGITQVTGLVNQTSLNKDSSCSGFPSSTLWGFVVVPQPLCHWRCGPGLILQGWERITDEKWSNDWRGGVGVVCVCALNALTRSEPWTWQTCGPMIY